MWQYSHGSLQWVIRAPSGTERETERERDRERERGHEMGWHFSASVPPVNPCAPEERSAMESCGGGEPWRHKAPLWSQRSWAQPCCVDPQSPGGNKDPPMMQHEKESDITATATAVVLTALGKVVWEVRQGLKVHDGALKKYGWHG